MNPNDWIFDGLEVGRYGLIYCDPPWRFDLWSPSGNEKKTPSAHYGVMGLKEIMLLPVSSLAAKDCLLVMWAVAPMLDQAIAVMGAWGFKFKTAGAWAKQSSTGEKWAFGTGYLLRGATEFFLIGTRGSPKSAVRDVRNLVVAPIREHSRKPDSFRTSLERMFPHVPRVELFARQRATGWDAWGNQVDKFAVDPYAEWDNEPAWEGM